MGGKEEVSRKRGHSLVHGKDDGTPAGLGGLGGGWGWVLGHFLPQER